MVSHNARRVSLLKNGIHVACSLSSKEFLLAQPRGAYTACRTVGMRAIFGFEEHVARLARSVSLMMQPKDASNRLNESEEQHPDNPMSGNIPVRTPGGTAHPELPYRQHPVGDHHVSTHPCFSKITDPALLRPLLVRGLNLAVQDFLAQYPSIVESPSSHSRSQSSASEASTEESSALHAPAGSDAHRPPNPQSVHSSNHTGSKEAKGNPASSSTLSPSVTSTRPCHPALSKKNLQNPGGTSDSVDVERPNLSLPPRAAPASEPSVSSDLCRRSDENAVVRSALARDTQVSHSSLSPSLPDSVPSRSHGPQIRMANGAPVKEHCASVRHIHRQRTDDYAREFRFTILIVWREQANEACEEREKSALDYLSGSGGESECSQFDILIHTTELPPPPLPPIKAEIRRAFRQYATAKDSQWVRDRDAFEGTKPADVNEILLEDVQGRILEGMTSNFFALHKDGVMWTASTSDGILGGTVRKLVLDICRENDIAVKLTPPSRASLPQWQSTFITSTSRLLLPIDEITVVDSESDIDKSTQKAPTKKAKEVVTFKENDTVCGLRDMVLDQMERSSPVVIELPSL